MLQISYNLKEKQNYLDKKINLKTMLPEIKTYKKSIKFSNPLVGKMYSNSNFTNKLNPQPIADMNNDTIIIEKKSTLQHLKLLSSNHQRKATMSPNERISKKLLTERKLMSKPRIQDTVRFFNDTIGSQYGNTIEFQDQYPQKNKKEYYDIIKLNSFASRLKPQKHIFPDISIVILDLIKCENDCADKKLSVNFGQYYKILFNKNSSGQITKPLIEYVQKYILKAKQNQKQLTDYPSSLFSYRNKQQVLKKIISLENKGKQLEILAIIRYYFLPAQQLRILTLKQIIRNLTEQVYKIFKIKHMQQFRELKKLIEEDKYEFVLIDQKGNKINDIAQFIFLNENLFMINRFDYENKNYKKIIDFQRKVHKKNQSFKKKSMLVQGLRDNFRNVVTKGNYQEKESDQQSSHDFINLLHSRRRKAESLVQRHRNSIKDEKPLQSYVAYKNSTPRSRINNNFSTLQGPRSQSMQNNTKLIKSRKGRPRMKNLQNSKEKIKIHQKLLLKSQNNYLIKISKEQLLEKFTKQQVNRIIKAYTEYKNKGTEKLNQQITVIEIKNEQSQLVSFIDQYLFNDQVTNPDTLPYKKLSFLLDVIILGSSRPDYNTLGQQKMKQKKVFLQTIWAWFESNNLLEFDDISDNEEPLNCLEQKGCLIRQKLINNAMKYQLIFRLLTCMIFGIYQKSMIEMAYEILVSE